MLHSLLHIEKREYLLSLTVKPKRTLQNLKKVKKIFEVGKQKCGIYFHEVGGAH